MVAITIKKNYIEPILTFPIFGTEVPPPFAQEPSVPPNPPHSTDLSAPKGRLSDAVTKHTVKRFLYIKSDPPPALAHLI